jgi:hypothetical protein
MGNGPCGRKDGGVESGGRGENQAAREQPRRRSRRRCWTCSGVRDGLGWGQTQGGKTAGKAEAGRDTFSGEGGERGWGSWS